MKLLLDEHYSPGIARQLRERGHDVVAVNERPSLVGLSDRELLSLMRDERRAVVTENAVHFVPLTAEALAAGEQHAGLLLTSPKSLPRRAQTIGTFVRVLDDFLRMNQREDACRNQTRWLQP